MNKKIGYGILALFVVGIVVSAGIVSAYKGDYSAQGPNYNEERHEAMTAAFETGDYDAWYALMTEDGRHPRVVDVVTAENFDKFVEAHNAGKSGDYETASALRAELGLNNGNGPRDGSGQGKGMQQRNFVDSDGDGVCDNAGTRQGRGRQ